MDALKKLQSMGMLNGANERIKPLNYYSEITVATGTNSYQFFTNKTLDYQTNNKYLPLSNNEFAVITGLKVSVLKYELSNITPSEAEIFTNSFIQILIDGREKAKFPLLEVLDLNFYTTIGNDNKRVGHKNYCRFKKLLYPLLINGNSNIEVNLFLSTNVATAYNNYNIRCDFVGIQTDKLINENINLVEHKDFEKISYTMYDVQTLVLTENEYSIFSDKNKSQEYYSKIFPLANNESFIIENIETFFVSLNKTGNISLIDNDLKKIKLSLVIDDVEYLNEGNEINASYIFSNSGSFTDAGAVITNYIESYFKIKNRTLEKSIIIPSNSNVKVTLRQPAVSYLSDNFVTCLRGTLIRTLA